MLERSGSVHLKKRVCWVCLYFENPVINTDLCLPVNYNLNWLNHSGIVLVCLWPIVVRGCQES